MPDGKNSEIEFAQIKSIEAKKYQAGSAGIEIITNDNCIHKFVLYSLKVSNIFIRDKEPEEKRNKIVELIKATIKQKS